MKKKYTGAEKAYREMVQWLAQDNRRTAQIMIDKSTGEVWADCFHNEGQSENYHSDDIVSISSFIINWSAGFDEINLENIKDAAEKIMDGWELYPDAYIL